MFFKKERIAKVSDGLAAMAKRLTRPGIAEEIVGMIEASPHKMPSVTV